MDYKNLIDPELRKSAHRYPFNKGVVIGGNIYQTAEWRFIKTPSEVEEKEIVLQGHNGLSFKTSVFTPKEAGNNILRFYMFTEAHLVTRQQDTRKSWQ